MNVRILLITQEIVGVLLTASMSYSILFQILTNFTVDKTFYIKNNGTSIVFGCKKARAKRHVASLNCIQGVWGYTASGNCDPACGLDDVKIANGVKVIYDDNEYVFQCLKNYDLIGTPVAHCPDYQPNAVYSTSVS